VIIDEVHAYDTYLTGLLARLLEWLAVLGCPVIILSATLPLHNRRSLVTAYRKRLGCGRGEEERLGGAGYPRMTTLDDAGPVKERKHDSSLDPRTVTVRWRFGVLDPSGALDFARELDELTAGERWARIGVICNSVPHAQATARALRTRFAAEITAGRIAVDLLTPTT